MDDPISRAVAHWRSKGVPMLPPLTPEAIQDAWRRLGRPLAADVVALYSVIGGFEFNEYDDHLWSLWPLDYVEEEHTRNPLQGVVIGDFLILSHEYSVRYEGQLRSSVWLEVGRGQVAPSLHDFLARLLDDPHSVDLCDGSW